MKKTNLSFNKNKYFETQISCPFISGRKKQTPFNNLKVLSLSYGISKMRIFSYLDTFILLDTVIERLFFCHLSIFNREFIQSKNRILLL